MVGDFRFGPVFRANRDPVFRQQIGSQFFAQGTFGRYQCPTDQRTVFFDRVELDAAGFGQGAKEAVYFFSRWPGTAQSRRL